MKNHQHFRDVEIEPSYGFDAWQCLPRIPHFQATDRTCARILFAIHENRRIRFRYLGGIKPKAKRIVTPAMLFTTSTSPQVPVYLQAWCHKRQAHRVFRLDRAYKLRVL